MQPAVRIRESEHSHAGTVIRSLRARRSLALSRQRPANPEAHFPSAITLYSPTLYARSQRRPKAHPTNHPIPTRHLAPVNNNVDPLTGGQFFRSTPRGLAQVDVIDEAAHRPLASLPLFRSTT